jgi:hypothetical protein
MTLFCLGLGIGITFTVLISWLAYLLLVMYFGGAEVVDDEVCSNCRMPRIEA